jgi:ketosteroid isomerase-like protein
MSQENVKGARAAFEAWNAGEMDALRDLLHPDVIMRMPEGWPEPGPYVGRDAVMREWRQLRETWDADSFEFLGDFMDLGDRVLVRYYWRGAGMGPDVSLDLTWVGTIRGGKIFYMEHFLDHAEALEALDLAE